MLQSETPEAKKESNLACKREIMTVFGLFFILRIVDIMYVTTAQGINSVITISIGIVCKICTLYRHCYHLFFDRQNDKKILQLWQGSVMFCLKKDIELVLIIICRSLFIEKRCHQSSLM